MCLLEFPLQAGEPLREVPALGGQGLAKLCNCTISAFEFLGASFNTGCHMRLAVCSGLLDEFGDLRANRNFHGTRGGRAR
mmetsp:Transcript_27933/g.78999  ORF Transcript_27933/g.78999 Transcript_27933/m.78999 type:complete len:80 (+) Transcript_27933:222-461(+)